MTITSNNINLIGDPDGDHVCPCGCGRVVSDDTYFMPSDAPREDLAVTLEARIAAAVASAAEKLPELRRDALNHVATIDECIAYFQEERAKASAKAARTAEDVAEVVCPCCTGAYPVADYRLHVAEGSTELCDRESWGSAFL